MTKTEQALREALEKIANSIGEDAQDRCDLKEIALEALALPPDPGKWELDEDELSDFIWKKSRGVLINAKFADELAKAICQHFTVPQQEKGELNGAN